MVRRVGKRRVRLDEGVHHGIDRGVAQLLGAIRPTLGPVPRFVAIERPARGMTPEVLDSGATIARRVIALPDAVEDIGATYLRGLLWRLHEEVGDGTATAAVIFSEVLTSGRQAIAAGVPAQQLRAALESAVERIRPALAEQVTPCAGSGQLVRLAESAGHDGELAELLGDLFDVIGRDGRLELRESKRSESWREFVEGTYWDSGALSTALLPDTAMQRIELRNCAIVISDLPIDEPESLIPALRAAHELGAEGLLLVARSITEAGIAMLTANHRPDIFPIVAVKLPGLTPDDQRAHLEDLALLTGGRVRLAAAGDRLATISGDDLGMARRAWATRQQFGIVAGLGDPHAIRDHVGRLRAAEANAKEPDERERLLHRLGAFVGGSGTLWIGAAADAEARHRRDAAERAANVLRHALRTGIVPGGGTALLSLQSSLELSRDNTSCPIEMAAIRILFRALEAPARALAENAGFEAAPVVDRIRRAGPGFGFDTLRGVIVNMAAEGILDSCHVLDTALNAAVRSAALALTVDAVVHTRKTDPSVSPE